MCRLLPRSHGLPRFPGGSASASSLSRPPQASRALRPAGSLNRPRRPLSRGFDQAGCPAGPLVSYQINRQLSGWNLPPLVIRAVGAHVESRTGAVAWAMRQRSVSRPRSSNRTCGFPASGFPTGFIVKPAAAAVGARLEDNVRPVPRRCIHARTAPSHVPAPCAVCGGSSSRGHRHADRQPRRPT